MLQGRLNVALEKTAKEWASLPGSPYGQPTMTLAKAFAIYAQYGGTLAGAGLRPRLRLWGIQAPELRDKDKQETVPGMASRAALENLLVAGGRRVSCRALKWRKA